MRWRLRAYIAPVVWIAGGAGFLALVPKAGDSHDPPRGNAEADPLDPADRATAGELLSILFSARAGDPAKVDTAGLAAWMASVERARASTRIRALYEILDRHYEALAGAIPPAAGSGRELASPWQELFADVRAWARRENALEPLRVRLRELWLPGAPADSVSIGIDDGHGRLAALWPDPEIPVEATTVAGWTVHRFDPSASIVAAAAYPPFRRPGLSLYLRVTSAQSARVVRFPLPAMEGAGEATSAVLSPEDGTVAGLVRVAWRWGLSSP